jgi:hypothetical protein
MSTRKTPTGRFLLLSLIVLGVAGIVLWQFMRLPGRAGAPSSSLVSSWYQMRDRAADRQLERRAQDARASKYYQGFMAAASDFDEGEDILAMLADVLGPMYEDPSVSRKDRVAILWALVEDIAQRPKPLDERWEFVLSYFSGGLMAHDAIEVVPQMLMLVERGDLPRTVDRKLLRDANLMMMSAWEKSSAGPPSAEAQRAERALHDYHLRMVESPPDKESRMLAMAALANGASDEDFAVIRRVLAADPSPPAGVLTAVEMPAVFANPERVERHFPEIVSSIRAGKRTPEDVATFNEGLHGYLDLAWQEREGASLPSDLRWSPGARAVVSDYLKTIEPAMSPAEFNVVNTSIWKRWFSSYAFMNSSGFDERVAFISGAVESMPLSKQVAIVEFYGDDPRIKSALKANHRIDASLAVAASSASVPEEGRIAAAAALEKLRGP